MLQCLKIENHGKQGTHLIIPALYFSLRYPLSLMAGIGFLWVAGHFLSEHFFHFADLLSQIAYWGIDSAKALVP